MWIMVTVSRHPDDEKNLFCVYIYFTESVGETEECSESVVIPLLLQNRVPDGYEEDDKVDVALRAEEVILNAKIVFMVLLKIALNPLLQ